MSLTAVPIESSFVLASTLLLTVIGLLATLRRGHWLTTLVFASSFLVVAAFQAGTLGILNADSPRAAREWAITLARSSALASWLWLTLSVVLARRDPWLQIRSSGAYLTLALVGCLALSVIAGSPHVVRDVVGLGGGAIVTFGTMGKIYLMYLVIAMVAVLMNLERMLRNAPPMLQRRLRPIFVALSFGILTELLVVSGGLLYNGIKVSWMVASAVPLFVAGVVTAMALARRRLSDLTVPVARPVIYYSSVSLTIAGAFLLTMAVLSKVLPILGPGAERTVSVAFYVLVGGGGLLLLASPRANRAIKRFIDRNFYANRYDYKREWERVSDAIAPTARTEDLVHQIDTLVRAVFDAERSAIYLRREATGDFDKALGPAEMPVTIAHDNMLVRLFEERSRPIVFREAALDLQLLPAAAENREAIQAMSASLCAPLMAGDVLVGQLWLSEKRNEEDYSYEDVEFLAAMSRQLAATLWFAQLAEQLAQTRQLESLHRLSTFVLHDIKNQVSGLSLVVENARRHLANPEFQRDAMAVVERTVKSLRELMNQVAGVARTPDVHPEPCDVGQLLEEAALGSGLAVGERDGVRLQIDSAVHEPVRVDRPLVLRVIVNLLTNAREALSGSGTITVSAWVDEGVRGKHRALWVSVTDTGRGMSEEFVRTQLFRPFATTKPTGLGVGLAQCRNIVEAHGGHIYVESEAGRGTTFRVCLPITTAGRVPPPADGETPVEVVHDVADVARGVAR